MNWRHPQLLDPVDPAAAVAVGVLLDSAVDDCQPVVAAVAEFEPSASFAKDKRASRRIDSAFVETTKVQFQPMSNACYVSLMTENATYKMQSHSSK